MEQGLNMISLEPMKEVENDQDTTPKLRMTGCRHALAAGGDLC